MRASVTSPAGVRPSNVAALTVRFRTVTGPRRTGANTSETTAARLEHVLVRSEEPGDPPRAAQPAIGDDGRVSALDQISWVVTGYAVLVALLAGWSAYRWRS